ncbi:hypothetical protein ACFQ32_08240 [Lactobacillus melliventris]|nr:hypothetical protein [Lactobacillus sp. M0396]
MDELWQKLQTSYRSKSISKADANLYKKWGKALKFLSENPKHPGLHTHEISSLTNRYGMKVWQSYLENKTSNARRMFWVYAPNVGDITIIGLDPHPENNKNGAYDRIDLSKIPK